jgi:gliding motility-associated-like protein
MKKIIFSLMCTMLFAFTISAQEFPMADMLYTECSGTFTDSQGVAADYLPDETFTTTICSPFPTDRVQVAFTQFDLAAGDVLIVYDGDSTSAPFLAAYGSFLAPTTILAGNSNTTGCLTFVFTSNPTSPAAAGWSADLSCIDVCQNIQSQVTVTPAPGVDGLVRVCQGDTVTIDGVAVFPAGSTPDLEILLPNGTRVPGNQVSQVLDVPGVYIFDFIVSDPFTGCRDRTQEDVVVLVSTTPDFTGTEAVNDIVCFGETVDITGVVETQQFAAQVAPPQSGTTFLPDVAGATYETEIEVNAFAPGATVNAASDLRSAYIIMEHSYMGDLDILLIAPNGVEVFFMAYPNGGGGTWLGEAIDVFPVTNAPGVGYRYTFTEQPTATQTLATAGQALPGAVPVPEGDYLPEDPFSDFIGSELNGDWTIRVVDNLSIDNGYIFEWGLNFNPNIIPPGDRTYEPVEVQEFWQANTDIIATEVVGDTTTITVQPSVVGINCYTFEFLDDFGCTYTEEVCIEQAAEVTTATPTPVEVCESLGNTTINLNPSGTESRNGLPQLDFSITYYENLADAEAGAPNTITNTSGYAVTSSADVYIRVFNRRTSCFEIETLSITYSNVTVSPAQDIDLCDVFPFDTTEIFDLTLNEIELIGTQDPTTVDVLYYTTLAAAQAGVMGTEIPDPTAYANTDLTETIHVRIQDAADAGCFGTGSFVINLLDGPPVGIAPDLSECDEAPFDLRLEFDLSLQDDSILDGLSSADYSVAYFISEQDAINDNNQLSSLYTADNGDVIYARLTDDFTGCDNISTFTVTVEGCEVIFPEGFSPDNDTINDTFEIPNVQQYANFELKVFNRLGSVIYETRATNYEEFKGVPNTGLNAGDGLLPVGTYFYVMKFNEPGIQDIASWLYINY